MTRRAGRKALVLACAAAAALAGCSRAPGPMQLLVFHADSLAAPFRRLDERFRESHPEVVVARESSGSNLAVRKIVDLHRPADVIVTADCFLIEALMMPEHCDWCARFVRNELAIAYTGMSKYASEISRSNWFDVLLREGVEYGHSDPNCDPCGYWTLLMLKLADLHYGRAARGKSIYEAIRRRCPPRNIRPDANQLLPLLEAPGGLDYVFVYLSQVRQHNLRCVRLPPEINLGDPSKGDLYARVSIELKGAGSRRTIRKVGRPIVYGAAVVKNCPHPRLALEYVKLLLSQAGADIMKDSGFEPISPALAVGRVPEELGCLVKRIPR